MIRVFDIDEPTTEIELTPNTLVQRIDLIHYLNTKELRFIGEPTPVQDTAVNEAVAVETGHEIGDSISVVIRTLTPEDRIRAMRMH